MLGWVYVLLKMMRAILAASSTSKVEEKEQDRACMPSCIPGRVSLALRSSSQAPRDPHPQETPGQDELRTFWRPCSRVPSDRNNGKGVGIERKSNENWKEEKTKLFHEKSKQ